MADEYYVKCDGPAWWPNMEYLLQARSDAVGNFVSNTVKLPTCPSIPAKDMPYWA